MIKLSTNKQSIKPNSTLILEARAKAKKEGWHKYVRQGLGETSDELAMVDGYYVDQYRIDNVVNFYENYSYLVESAFAGQPFRLMPWQQTLLSELMGWCRYEIEWQRVCRRFRVGYVVAGKKIGKLLSDDTIVPTPNGWKRHGSLKVGDKLFDQHGKVVEVIKVHPKHVADREVVFTNGERVKCSKEHEWVVESLGSPGSVKATGNYYGPYQAETQQIASRLMMGSALNYRIKMHGGITCPERSFPVDPYLLGLWIGDGDQDQPRLTLSQAKLERFVEEFGESLKGDYSVSEKTGDSYRVRINNDRLVKGLRKLNLINNKHIPAIYLRGSRDQRLALLQGLLDTDGTISKDGKSIEISQKRGHIATGIADLLSGLGIKFSRKLKRKICKNNGKAGWYHTFAFHVTVDELQVFRIKHKLERMRKSSDRQMSTGRSRHVHIKEVNEIDPVPGNCITVSGDGTYLCGYTMLPTHNSPLESVLGAYLLTADSPDVQSNVSSVGPTRAVAQRMLTFINRMKKHSPELDAVIDVTRPDGFLQISHNDNVWTPLPAEPASVEGLQSHVLIDELHRIKGAGAWEFFESLMYALAAMPDGMFFTITNAGDDPTSPARYLYEKTIDVNLGRVVDHQHYGKLYECLPSDDLDNEKNWYKANPSLGDETGMIPGTDIPAPLKLSTFRAEFQTAKRNPRTWQNFKRLRFSIWTSAADSWLDGNVIGGYQAWDAGDANRSLSTDPNLDCYRAYDLDYLTELADNNCPCYFSFDLASVRDTTSAVFTIHDVERDELLTHALCFLPEETVAASQNRILYETAAERGELTITPGQVTNIKAVIQAIVEVAQKLNPLAFAYDPWQASMVYQEIANQLCIEPIKFPQTFANYHPLLNEAERLIALRKIRHNGNSLFNWQLGNMRVRRNNEGQKRPEKQLLNAELKIDIAVSFVMSLAKFCEVQEESTSYYDENEVESV